MTSLSTKQQLRQAAMALQFRSMKLSCKWCAELLAGMYYEGPRDEKDVPVLLSTQSSQLLLTANEAETSDRFFLAKSYFDLGEFQRAVFVLDAQKKELDALELFLRSYALFLAGEKSKEQETLELNDPLERSKVVNPNLRVLHSDLLEFHKQQKLDAFGLYILGSFFFFFFFFSEIQTKFRKVWC